MTAATADKNPWVRRTRLAALAGLVLYPLYDLAAYRLGGGAATLSTVAGDALKGSAWLSAGFGLLCGHLYASGCGPLPGRVLAAFALAWLLGFLCTAR